MRCFKCEGFGHIKTEFPTFIKKHKKGITITRFDMIMRVKMKHATQVQLLLVNMCKNVNLVIES